MRRISMIKTLVAILGFATMVISCGRYDLLVVRDPYWRKTDFGEEVEKKVDQAGEIVGKNIEYVDIGYPADPSEIVTAVTSRKSSVVLLSPLFSTYAREIANSALSRRIIAFGLGSGGAVQVGNLSTIAINRKNAFRLAGTLCRDYLAYPGNEAKKVLGLFYAGGSERALERNAFEKGLGEELVDRYFIKTFPQLDGIGEINSYLAELAKEPVGLVLISMSGLNRETILSVSTKYQATVITERVYDKSGDYPYEDRILATVEENWVDILSYDLPNSGPEIVINASLLPGPAASPAFAPWAGGFLVGDKSR